VGEEAEREAGGLTMAEKEYIDRKAEIEALRERAESVEKLGAIGMAKDIKRVIKFIKKFPAADVVEVVHARWITEENTEGYRGDPHCTACKGILDDEAVYGHTPGVDSFFYCPLCGAKMDGGAE
jgi:hypothetical protein